MDTKSGYENLTLDRKSSYKTIFYDNLVVLDFFLDCLLMIVHFRGKLTKYLKTVIMSLELLVTCYIWVLMKILLIIMQHGYDVVMK